MAKKILIVDDEPDMLAVATFRLKKNGYDVITATDGRQAIESIKKDMPDLILLDLRIPLISGYDICRRVKSNDKLKHIYIILFTASATTNLSCKAGELVADDYIIKPFDADILLEKIRKLIG